MPILRTWNQIYRGYKRWIDFNVKWRKAKNNWFYNISKWKKDRHAKNRKDYAQFVGVSYEENTDENGPLYSNIGEKIKGLAKGSFILETITVIITGFAFFIHEEFLIGFLIILFAPIVAWVSSWLLYAFGELVDKTAANERNTYNILKLMLDNNANNKQ